MIANESKILSNSQHLQAHSIPRRHSHLSKEQNNTDISNPVKEYAEASSIHGIKYITEEGRHQFERCDCNSN